jgi:hypothetical protein
VTNGRAGSPTSLPSMNISLHRKSTLNLGRMPLVAIVFGCLIIIGTLATFLQLPSSGPRSWASVLGNSAGFGLAAGLAGLIVTARLEAVDGSLFRVVNIFFAIEVGKQHIAGFDAKEGWRISTLDGARFGSSAYGQSLGGQILGYRRATRAATRCAEWLDADAANGAEAQRPPRRRLRPACWPLVLAWPLTYCAIGSVVFAVWH